MEWTLETLTAFRRVMYALCKYPILHAPLPDLVFIVYTATSAVGLGANPRANTPFSF